MMKKLILLTVLSLVCIRSEAQQLSYDDYAKVNKWFKLMDYNNAILALDTIITKYPRFADMYFNRGLSEYYLNDQPAADKDFLKAKNLGFKESADFIKWKTNLAYRVKSLVGPYIDYKLLDTAHGFSQVFGKKDSLQGGLRPQRTCYDVYFYDLTVKIIPKKKSIEGSNQIYFKVVDETNQIQIDLADNLKINSIIRLGKKLKFTRICNAVFVNFDEMLPKGENEMVTVNYEGKPHASKSPPWDGGFVWKKNRGNWWIGVACEHYGASSWWPCKDHLSDKPDSMRINVQVPQGYQGVANGNFKVVIPMKNHYNNWVWFVSYPINNYGVTFYMGKFVNFDEVITDSEGSFPIDYYVLPQNLDTAKKYYSQTKDIVKVYEKLFGNYPCRKDGLAMVEAPYAGMEHQGAIAIGDEYGKKQRRNYEIEGYDNLLIHETAHEWWGNTVTMGDMADAWLSESFATYSEHLFAEQLYGYDKYLEEVAKGMQAIENIWCMVGARDVNYNSFLGGDIYSKGATMLHNLRCEMNDDSLFFSTLKGYYAAYKFKIASTQDFITFVNHKTEKDYTDFFTKFLYDKDPPVLQYFYKLKNDSLVFSYRWNHVGKNFTMPFGIFMNDNKSIRLEGTSDWQTYKAEKVKSFYIPNEIRFTKNMFVKNSFTYFWSEWIR